MLTTKNKISQYRWVICSMLFFATTINYMDRQVLSLTWKDFIAPEFHWTDADYGNITGAFSFFYALFSLFVGKFIDRLGTKRGYLIAIFVWSLGACLHAICGWVTMQYAGLDSVDALSAVKAGSQMALMISTVSVYLFMFCRIVLAMGESGNFPSAIKVVAEFFPKKDRAFATAIFNSGASIGALIAPLTIPVLANYLGWESAFVIIGGIGFVWMGFWVFIYDQPSQCKHVNEAELAYILQDDAADSHAAKAAAKADGPTLPFMRCFTYRQTWSFIMGKFMTDGVWWFYLFWAPAYFSDQFGYASSTTMGQWLIFVLYLIVTALSIVGGYIPKYFVEHRGMEPYSGRMKAMFIFALLPLLALVAQPLASWKGSPIDPAWWPAIIIGLAGAGHQAWSANLYSTIGDMFPRSAVATITGVGTMAGGISSWAINTGSGYLFNYAEQMGAGFTFLGFEGKPAGYMIVFCFCAVAYMAGWIIMKTLVPKYKPIEV